MVKFFVECIPPTTTAQMRRHANGHSYRPQKLENAIATFHQILAPHKPEKPIDGPVSVTIAVTWPWRKSESKRTKAKGRIPHNARPDLDNWVKQLIDELVTWRFIERDQEIAELTIRKFWGDVPGIGVAIEPMRDPHERYAL